MTLVQSGKHKIRLGLGCQAILVQLCAAVGVVQMWVGHVSYYVRLPPTWQVIV